MDATLRQQYDLRHPLYCGSSGLLISTNLRDALRSVRHPSLPTQLCVDAVCINQQDDAERSSQILLMPRIYHRAPAVLLWLGEADEDTQPAFSMICRLATQLQRFTSERIDPDSWHDEALAAHFGLPSLSSGAYGPLLRLLDRPVFRRI